MSFFAGLAQAFKEEDDNRRLLKKEKRDSELAASIRKENYTFQKGLADQAQENQRTLARMREENANERHKAGLESNREIAGLKAAERAATAANKRQTGLAGLIEDVKDANTEVERRLSQLNYLSERGLSDEVVNSFASKPDELEKEYNRIKDDLTSWDAGSLNTAYKAAGDFTDTMSYEEVFKDKLIDLEELAEEYSDGLTDADLVRLEARKNAAGRYSSDGTHVSVNQTFIDRVIEEQEALVDKLENKGIISADEKRTFDVVAESYQTILGRTVSTTLQNFVAEGRMGAKEYLTLENAYKTYVEDGSMVGLATVQEMVGEEAVDRLKTVMPEQEDFIDKFIELNLYEISPTAPMLPQDEDDFVEGKTYRTPSGTVVTYLNGKLMGKPNE